MITTKRLILRPWQESDLIPFAQLNADPKVMTHYPSTLTTIQSNEYAQRIIKMIEENGWGPWAVEAPGVAKFIGYVGLMHVPWQGHFTPAIEIGWRIAHQYWGQGYATEAATAALAYGFATLKLPEIVSFTIPANIGSWRVMEKIGMNRNPEEDFAHPKLAKDHPLSHHVLYRIKAEEYKNKTK